MNRSRSLTFLVLATACCAVTSLSAQETATPVAPASERLEKLWSTPAELKIPESSLYDSARKIIYVSNMADTTGVKNGQGFIAKVSPTGAILDAHWITGLHAPKGLALAGSRLFVSGIDEVVEIDVDRGAIVQRHPIPGAKDLNDVAITADGTVLITDTEKDQRFIFSLKDGQAGVFLESDEIKHCNGIFADGDRILVAGKGGRLLAVDRATKAITVLVAGTGYIDGIVKIAADRFLISDWKGTVQLLETGRPPVKLLDSKVTGINAADLGWIAAEQTILVPTFADNRVVAYRLRN